MNLDINIKALEVTHCCIISNVDVVPMTTSEVTVTVALRYVPLNSHRD
jgi:hypothetical protein